MSEKASSFRRQFKALMALAIAQFGDFGESQVNNSMFPAIRAALGLDISALGLILAAKRGVQIVGTPLWGYLADRFSRKAVLVWGTGIWGAWTILMGFSRNFSQLLTLTVISGLGIAALEGPLSSLLSDLFPSKERGRAFGIVRGLAYIGMMLTLVYYSLLAKRFPDSLSWRMAYWTFGGISVLSGLLIWLFVQEPVRGGSEEALQDLPEEVLRREEARHPFSWPKAFGLFRIPTFALSMLDTFVVAFPFVILVAYSVTWLVDDRGFSNARAILFTLAGLIGLILGSAVGGWVGDRAAIGLTDRGRLWVGHGVQALFALMLVLLFVVEWRARWVYLALLFLVGFLLEFKITGVLKVIVSGVLLPEVRSLGFAVERAVDSIGRVASALLVGYLARTYGLTQALIWFGAGMAALGILIYFPYYSFFFRDAARLQEQLRERLESLP